MDFLFFDIECATCAGGGKLCEFGYVLTDAEFNIKEKDGFLIDPDSVFDNYVINNMLHHKLKEYKESPRFPVFYDRIKALLTAKNTVIVGHTVKGDVEHVGDDCIRYNLPFFDLSYVDIAELYKIVSEKRDSTGLIKMCAELGVVPSKNAHSAVCDAEMTMFALKAIILRTGLDFAALCDKRPSAVQNTVGYEEIVRRKKTEATFRAEQAAKGVRLTSKKDYANIVYYAVNAPSDGKRIKAVKGKRVALSGLFENTRFTETLNLIRLLKSGGAKFTPSVKNCNMFMSYRATLSSGETVYCKKAEEAKSAILKGKSIEIVPFEKLLEILGVAEKDLLKPVNFLFP